MTENHMKVQIVNVFRRRNMVFTFLLVPILA